MRRLFRARFLLGMFDPPEMVPYAQIPFSENDTEAHRQLALKTSRESMVLLKNDGILPLTKAPKNIAVVGPLADNKRVLEGNYNGTPSRSTIRARGHQEAVCYVLSQFRARDAFPARAKVVPASLFYTPEGQPGLKAEYFKNKELSGTAAVTRVDRKHRLQFYRTPIPGFSSGAFSIENFSARWTGFFTPAESGTYQLGMRADDGFRLWLDGKMVVEDWTTHGVSTKLASVKLEKGHKYALKAEYFQATGDAIAQMVWNNELARKAH